MTLPFAMDYHGELKPPARWPVVMIGVTKLVKSAGLWAIGFGILGLLNVNQRQAMTDFVTQAHPHNWYLNFALAKALAIPHDTLRMLHVASFVYAGLYAIEGIGLLANRPWAEWMVVVTTGGFVPIEVYEMCRRFTAVRVSAFTINVAILVYLCVRLRRQHLIKLEEKTRSTPFVMPEKPGESAG